MNVPLFRWLFPVGLVALLAACSPHLPVRNALPPGLVAQQVARLDPAAPLAVSSDSRWLALGDHGVLLRATDADRQLRLATAPPLALAFNGDSSQLLVASTAATQTRLQLFTVADATLKGELLVDGSCGSLLWHDGDWLALCSIQEHFKFGSNLRTRLLRWDGRTVPREEPLNDATLDPATVRQWGAQVATLGMPQLSPFGDELLYLKVIDPPAFPPYRRVVLRHLASGAEQGVCNLPMSPAAARYAASGEEVYCGDGQQRTVLRDPWANRDEAQFATPGRSVAVSPAGRYLWLDGVLQRDGVEWARFDRIDAAWFGPAGTLWLRSGHGLWQLRGLDEPPPPPLLPADATARSRQLQLRQWRSSGLIDHNDYLQQRGEP